MDSWMWGTADSDSNMNVTTSDFGVSLGLDNTTATQRCLYAPRHNLTSDLILARFVLVVPVWLFMALLGLIGNTLAYLVLRKELRPSSTAYLLKTLAVVDNLVLIMVTLDDSLVRIYMGTGRFESYWDFYTRAHPVMFPLKWISKTLSVYTIMLVTAERYTAVCKPLHAASFCTIRNARIAFAAVCIFAIFYNLPKFWQLESFIVYDPCIGRERPWFRWRNLFKTSFFWAMIYGVALYIIILFIIPLVVLGVLNFFLIRNLRGGIAGASDRLQRHKRQVTKRIVIIVLVFVLLELPPFITNIIRIIQAKLDLDLDKILLVHLMQSFYVISGMNSLVNFYVYFLTGASFRQTLWRMLTGKRRPLRKPRPSQSGISDTGETEFTALQGASQRDENGHISSLRDFQGSVAMDNEAL